MNYISFTLFYLIKNFIPMGVSNIIFYIRDMGIHEEIEPVSQGWGGCTQTWQSQLARAVKDLPNKHEHLSLDP